MFTNITMTPSPNSNLNNLDDLNNRRKVIRYRNSIEDMLHTHLRHKQKNMSLSERIERNKRQNHQLSQLNQNEISIIRKYSDAQILKCLEPKFC